MSTHDINHRLIFSIHPIFELTGFSAVFFSALIFLYNIRLSWSIQYSLISSCFIFFLEAPALRKFIILILVFVSSRSKSCSVFTLVLLSTHIHLQHIYRLYSTTMYMSVYDVYMCILNYQQSTMRYIISLEV